MKLKLNTEEHYNDDGDSNEGLLLNPVQQNTQSFIRSITVYRKITVKSHL